MVDGLVIYDSVVHNPTAEEKKILDGITFKEKNEYRYKVDNKYVYYVKEDLEKNPPFIQDTKQMESMKDLGKTKKVSEELPVGAVSREMNEKDANAKELPEEWDEAFRTIQPFYLYQDQAIKIVDQKMYDTVNGKEGIVVTGKTDDFVAYTKEWKNLMSCS